jgi:choline dehydrogenase-like flavoprotein
VGAIATFDGYADRYYQGNRPNGIYVPRFRNLGADSAVAGFVRGYGMQGRADRIGWERGATRPGIGALLKTDLREPGPWRMTLSAFGEVLPNPENRCTLDEEVTDAYGIPALRMDVAYGANEMAMREDMAATAEEMLAAAGAAEVQVYDRLLPPGTTNHEMGTARMGRDPATSVLNGFNQCHAVPNLFVTDGACMASSACQNPSLTYLALTARACDYAVEQLKQGRI